MRRAPGGGRGYDTVVLASADEAEGSPHLGIESAFPIANPQAFATTPRRPRRRLETQKLTSTDLIDQAEASGRLGHETAVLYRVYTIFGDARLPSAYRGNDAPVFESLYLGEIQAEWDTYSAPTQAALAPFFIPPAYAGSWAAAGAAALSTGVPEPVCTAFNPYWAFKENSQGKVRVWYEKSADDGGVAAVLATAVDTKIWPGFAEFMAPHEPLSDGGSACDGGSGRLDIYIVDMPVSTNMAGYARATDPAKPCSPTSGVVYLKRGADPQTLAHEIFHIFQYSFPLAGSGCYGSPDYHWWTEGSAEWASDKIFPFSQLEHALAGALVEKPELPLDLDKSPHVYATYLLPFYYYRSMATPKADFVRIAWEGCASANAVTAVNSALSGGFETVWPKVALHNWNTVPVDDYEKWDALKARPIKADLKTTVVLKGALDAEFVLPVDLPGISATYEDYLFTDDSVRSVAFWNGAAFNLQESSAPGTSVFSPYWDPQPAAADATKGVHVQALIKMKNQPDWQIADWTNDPVHSFCRDVTAEKIEELVVIISNSQYLDHGKRATPPGKNPRLHVSNMGCYQWTGTMSSTFTTPGTVITVVGDPVTWTRVNFGGAVPDPSVLYTATGKVTATETGQCTGSGVFDILPFPAGISNLLTANYAPIDSSSRRAYTGSGQDGVNTFTAKGANCGSTGSQTYVGAWFGSPAGPGFTPPFLFVSANGTTISDHWTAPGGTPGTSLVFTWNLHSTPQ